MWILQPGASQRSLGDTRCVVVSAHLDAQPPPAASGNFGYNRQDPGSDGPDFGRTSFDWGFRRERSQGHPRQRLPTFENGYTIGTTPSWMPLYRKEINYSFSSALTKVFAKHEVRAGVDIVKLELNHRQAEFGNYGLKGGFSFSGNTTGASGYTALQWNQFAGFLMGLPSFFAKDVQTETMTGREWQNAFYVSDRWRVTPNLTLNLGVRLENYPLMTREASGIELLDLSTYTVLLAVAAMCRRTSDSSSKNGTSRRVWAWRTAWVPAGVRRAMAAPSIRPLVTTNAGLVPDDINFNRSASSSCLRPHWPWASPPCRSRISVPAV